MYPGRQKSVGEWRYKLESGFVWGILLLILSILPAGMSRSSWLAAVAGCGVVTAFYYRIRKQLKELGRKLGKKAWWVAAFLASLKGEKGEAGQKGEQGDVGPQGPAGVGLTGAATVLTAIADPESATAADIANKVNEIIAVLNARGVSKPE